MQWNIITLLSLAPLMMRRVGSSHEPARARYALSGMVSRRGQRCNDVLSIIDKVYELVKLGMIMLNRVVLRNSEPA
jgi:hypothetical protein